MLFKIKHGRDAFLVLTTDGINCVMSDQEICDVIQRTEDPNDAAHCLTDAALHYSSEDNATAIVVPLGSWGNSNQIICFSNIPIALNSFVCFFSFQK